MKFLVFDMDGILADTTACHARAFEDLWRLCGVDGPPYSMLAGRPTRDVVREYAGPDASLEERVTFKQQRAREYLRSEPVAFDDVLPALEALQRAGFGMGVATGASRETAVMLLERLRIANFFRFLLTAEDVRRGKPDPEIYRAAAERAGTPAGETIVVEDSAAGLEAAVRASAFTACVRTGLRLDSPFFLGSYPGLLEFARSLGVPAA